MPPAFQAIPIFRIFDVDKAKEFYIQISRDGLLLHLSEHHGDACPGSTVTVQVTGPAGGL